MSKPCSTWLFLVSEDAVTALGLALHTDGFDILWSHKGDLGDGSVRCSTDSSSSTASVLRTLQHLTTSYCWACWFHSVPIFLFMVSPSTSMAPLTTDFARDKSRGDGYLLAVLVALVLLAMLAAYMCLLREEMHSDFEEFRALGRMARPEWPGHWLSMGSKWYHRPGPSKGYPMNYLTLPI